MTATPFWRPAMPGPCWVCGDETEWAYLDIGWQHPDCDAYPTEDGDVRVVRGVTSEAADV